MKWKVCIKHIFFWSIMDILKKSTWWFSCELNHTLFKNTRLFSAEKEQIRTFRSITKTKKPWKWKLIWLISKFQFSSVQFSRSVVSDSLRPHESQHARPPCPSPTPGVHSESHPLSQWCHPAISSSVLPFSSGPQSLPASESFSMSQLFTWVGQSTGVSASASFPPKKSQGWSPAE